MRRPLEGLRVLDLTLWQQGTYATAMLADLGADVMKIEEPESGDPGRHFYVLPNLGLSPYFQAHNRGKRSCVLDLKADAGREVLLRLASSADAFLTNYRIGAIERLRITYDDLAAANPRLVYVHASGYGHLGDDAGNGAFDLLAQARGGIMSMTGEPDGPPLSTIVPIADQAGAYHACIALLAGIASRDATGKGMRFDTSLLGSQVSMQSFNISAFLFGGQQQPRRPGGGDRPWWRTYRGGDGEWFVIGMLLDRCWPEVLDVIERRDLEHDERFDTYAKRVATNAPTLIAALEASFTSKPARHWIDALNAVGMFAAPVNDYAALTQDAQVLANGYVHEVERPGHEPVRMAGIGISADGEPLTVTHLAPEHGEHTEDVLLEAGYTWDEITQLRDAGAIGARKHEG